MPSELVADRIRKEAVRSSAVDEEDGSCECYSPVLREDSARPRSESVSQEGPRRHISQLLSPGDC